MVRGVDNKTSSDQFIQIIKCVERRPNLYHKDLSEHGHDARMQIWNEVGQQVNLPAITCKERWRYARSVYVRHSRNENVGKAGDNLVKHLHFLKKHISFKKKPLAEKPSHTKIHKPATSSAVLSSRKRTLMKSTDCDIKQTYQNNDKTIKLLKQKRRKFSRHSKFKTSLQSFMEEGYVDTFTKLQNIRKRSRKKHNDLNSVKEEYNSHSDSDVVDEDPVLEFVYDKREKRIKEFSKEDSDLHFLKSLLLEMKLMNCEQKEEFKSKMVALAKEAIRKPNNGK